MLYAARPWRLWSAAARARELLDAHWQIYELLRTKNTDGLEDLIRATYFLNIVNN